MSKIKLETHSAVFFTHMVQAGLAKFESDSSMPEGEAHAELVTEDGKSHVKIKAQSDFFFCL